MHHWILQSFTKKQPEKDGKSLIYAIMFELFNEGELRRRNVG